MYTRPHGATFQRTTIFMLTAVIISILRPGRSRRDTKQWRFVSTERHCRTRQHCWWQQRRGTVTLEYTHQWHVTHTSNTLHTPVTHYTHQWHITNTSDTLLHTPVTHYTHQWHITHTSDTLHTPVTYYYTHQWHITHTSDTLRTPMTHSLSCWPISSSKHNTATPSVPNITQ